MNKRQIEALTQLFTSDPLAYRHFGPWWYFIKAEARRLGYGPQLLRHWGDYVDPEAAKHLPTGLPVDQRVRLAYYHYAEAAANQYGSDRHLGDDGEIYWIHDTDVEVS